MSGIIRPYVPLLPYFNVVALLFGKNLTSSITLRTRSTVSGRTRFDPLITRDTVALETPASFAMSRISIVQPVVLGIEDELRVALHEKLAVEIRRLYASKPILRLFDFYIVAKYPYVHVYIVPQLLNAVTV
jgi:hypothetical protein